MDYIEEYLKDVGRITAEIDCGQITKIIGILKQIQDDGKRLFVLGVGGSAANASHAVNDFRKICGMEAYTPADNVSELTARINDDGWDSAYANWLKGSRLGQGDGILVFSVGGGNEEKQVSVNLIRAIELARKAGAHICGIVGRDGGYTAAHADACVIIPPVNQESVTPYSEAFQAVVWHLIVSHPTLRKYGMKWETTRQVKK